MKMDLTKTDVQHLMRTMMVSTTTLTCARYDYQFDGERARLCHTSSILMMMVSLTISTNVGYPDDWNIVDRDTGCTPAQLEEDEGSSMGGVIQYVGIGLGVIFGLLILFIIRVFERSNRLGRWMMISMMMMMRMIIHLAQLLPLHQRRLGRSHRNLRLHPRHSPWPPQAQLRAGPVEPSHTKQRSSVSFADIAIPNTDTPKWPIANHAKAKFWNATEWTIQTGCNRTTKSGSKDTAYCTKLKRTKSAGSQDT